MLTNKLLLLLYDDVVSVVYFILLLKISYIYEVAACFLMKTIQVPIHYRTLVRNDDERSVVRCDLDSVLVFELAHVFVVPNIAHGVAAALLRQGRHVGEIERQRLRGVGAVHEKHGDFAAAHGL